MKTQLPAPLSGHQQVAFGQNVVKLHDQHGLTFDVSLEMAADQGLRPALLGILMECARRKMSHRFVR